MQSFAEGNIQSLRETEVKCSMQRDSSQVATKGDKAGGRGAPVDRLECLPEETPGKSYRFSNVCCYGNERNVSCPVEVHTFQEDQEFQEHSQLRNEFNCKWGCGGGRL